MPYLVFIQSFLVIDGAHRSALAVPLIIPIRSLFLCYDIYMTYHRHELKQ
jgi:hypothetical protein